MQQQLEGFEYHRSLASVWPEAVRLLGEGGFGLDGKDRVLAGQPVVGLLGLFNRASETHDIGNGQQALETDWNGRDRYRVEGTTTGAESCFVHFILIRQDAAASNHEKVIGRDFEAELALLTRIDPEQANQVEDGAREAAATGTSH